MEDWHFADGSGGRHGREQSYQPLVTSAHDSEVDAVRCSDNRLRLRCSDVLIKPLHLDLDPGDGRRVREEAAWTICVLVRISCSQAYALRAEDGLAGLD